MRRLTEICPLCGSRQYKVAYVLRDFNIIMCSKCGLMSRDKKLTLQKIKELYSKKYFVKQQKAYFAPCLEKNAVVKKENSRIQDFLYRLSDLNSIVENRKNLRKNIFDIGCATGTFLELCRERGWQVAGNDVSHYAIQKARENNLKVWESSMENYKKNGIKYSVITGWEVVPNFERPDIAFNNIISMIKPGGVLAIQLTVVDSIIFYLSGLIYHISGGKIYQLIAKGFPVNHAYHYSRKTLNLLLKKYGFKKIKDENIIFNFRYSYFPKVLLPALNLINILGKLTGKTTQYRVYAKKNTAN